MVNPAAIPVLFIGGGVVLVGGIIYLAVRAEKKRNAAMQVVAQTMGFSYQDKCDGGLPTMFAGSFPVLDRGHSRKAQRLMQGKLADRDVAIFDYCFTTGGGKSQHRHNQTVLIFPRGAEGITDFTLEPENFLHKIGQVFGYQDIDFPDFPDFSKHYLLRGPSEEGIRKAFDTNVLTLLGGSTGWQVQASDGRLAIFREGSFAKPEEIPTYAAEALRIAGVFRTVRSA